MAKKTKVNWLNRSLLVGPYLTLVTSQNEFDQALRDLDLPVEGDPFINPGAHATTHTYTMVKGSLASIVGLSMESAAKVDPIDVAALLVHEAVHVWQNLEDSAGKMGCFGTEGEAYAIQNISAQLMDAYAKKLHG